MTDTPLPPSFDLFLDAKSYSDLETQYRQACETKIIIEQLCREHSVPLPNQPRAAIPAVAPGVRVKPALEDVACEIYEAMRYERKESTPAWVRNGNSNAQVKARATAARILAALPPAPDAVEACGGCGNADPSKRCFGCHHVFEKPDAVRDETSIHERALEYVFGKCCDWERIVNDQLIPPLPLEVHWRWMRPTPDAVEALVKALEYCPPTSNPDVSAEEHLLRIATWWRIYARPVLAAIRARGKS
jgi:hypothetical protein